MRGAVTTARRTVVKVGSSSLTTRDGGLDLLRVDTLVDTLADVHRDGNQIVFVSSGAIAAGLRPLGLAARPRDLATLQAAASVGQGLLVERYAASFARHGVRVGQVLLTADDMVRRAHYRNAQRTLNRLLELQVLPIVNENDAVATEEIRFGDNDRLAALVCHLVQADLLILLSDVDGLYDGDPRRSNSRMIPEVRSEQDLAGIRVSGRGASGLGSGGMATKVDAARLATAAGTAVVLTSGEHARAALRGESVGTYFHPSNRKHAPRLLWLAHATTPRGRLWLDPGAVDAVVVRRLSLLPAGVTKVDGEFAAGDPVELVDENGHAVARGLVNYDAGELPDLLGRSTRELSAALGPAYEREVVHRDQLVVLT